uniref:Putative secreted peptide n=1 Tax=Anopheles braziliensis TaxID=58242 RepID=A0A2M3ZVW4_9DIPT
MVFDTFLILFTLHIAVNSFLAPNFGSTLFFICICNRSRRIFICVLHQRLNQINKYGIIYKAAFLVTMNFPIIVFYQFLYK